jgi:hypothetical protein
MLDSADHPELRRFRNGACADRYRHCGGGKIPGIVRNGEVRVVCSGAMNVLSGSCE